MESIRILLADDKKLFLESMKLVIETLSQGGMEIVGLASNGLEAVKLTEKYNPDVILMDVRMPVLDGVKASQKILASYPEIRIIMLTTFNDDDDVKDAMSYGASGYLLKDVRPVELISFIETVYKGSVILAPDVARQLFQNQLQETVNSLDQTGERLSEIELFLDDLTPREVEVYKLLTKGMTNKEISYELFIAEQTAKNHIANIYSKLGIHNRYDIFRK